MKPSFIPGVICLTDPNQPTAAAVPASGGQAEAKPGAITVVEPAEAAENLPTPERKARFHLLDGVVKQTAAAFAEGGTALAAIKKEKLYLEEFPNWTAYCRARLNCGRAHAYRLMEEARIAGWLSCFGDKAPTTQALVRPLLGMGQPQAVTAYRKALDTAGGRPLTPRIVAEAAAGVRAAGLTGRSRARIAEATTPGKAAVAAAPQKSLTAMASPPVAAARAEGPLPAKVTQSLRTLEDLLGQTKMYVSSDLNYGRAFAVLLDAERELSRLRCLLTAATAPHPQPCPKVPTQSSNP